MILPRHNRVVLAALLSLFVVRGYVHAADVASPAMPYRVSADGVADAFAKRGISVQRVEFLASVKSSRPDPALEIERCQRTSRDSVLARIRCHEAGVCLPFLVILHLAPGQDPQGIAEPAPTTQGQLRTTGSPHRPNWTVKIGQTATLVMQGRDVRATTPVICLQNGRQGETIRVTSLDRQRIWVGEIVGPGLLRGAL